MVSHTTETQNLLMLSLRGCVLAVSIWCQSLKIPEEPLVISPCLKSKEASSNVSKGSSSGSRDRVDELIDKWEGHLSKMVSFSFSHVLRAGLLPEDVTYNKVAFPHQLRQWRQSPTGVLRATQWRQSPTGVFRGQPNEDDPSVRLSRRFQVRSSWQFQLTIKISSHSTIGTH